MRRLLFVLVVALVSTLPLTINAVLAQKSPAGSPTPPSEKQPDKQTPAIDDDRDSPPDTTPYFRKALPQDYAPGGRNALTPSLFVRDVVVSNTNANLTNTDTANDGEPSIAINPANPNEIVLTAFSGSWGANAPLWHSTDGGSTWTKRFTIPVPPGTPSATNCPCDQAVDYGRAGRLSGTFLTFSPTDPYSGTTTNPASSASWNWLLDGMGNAVRTNSVAAGNTDQPWLLVNRDTATASQDNVYVAYDDFTISPRGMRVAVAGGSNPPNFTVDSVAGFGPTGTINPGHRLAVDPSTGFVYSLFQQFVGAGSGGSRNVNFMLNRSTDSGATWGLNGSPTGVLIANTDSTQPTPKFGTVNALLGGVDHAAVDPTNSDVYYVYGNRDSGTGNNRVAIRRLQDNGSGGLTIGSESFVTGQVQAALPSVAVTTNGVVGVLFDTFDGLDASTNFPIFTAHLSASTDHGSTFTDFVLETFLSSAKDCCVDPSFCNPGADCTRQRVLGDYQQVKALGTTFYGVFTGNGVPFGRPFANHDPIFFKVQTNCTITCPANITQSNDPGQCGAVVNYPPPTAVSCGTVTCSPPSGSFFPKGTTTVTCTTQQPQSCAFTVTVNDTQPPTITCPPNKTQSTDPGLCSAVVTYNNATATDNCPGVGTPVCSPASGSTFLKGITTVTCNVSDASSIPASCSFTITVNDTEKPTINCPAPVTAITDQNPCPSPLCTVVNYPAPVAMDNCPGPITTQCIPPSGSCFLVGITTVTCTATDTSGNISLPCTFTVTVFDTALQDDSNPAIILLWNSISGQYRFCCNGITFTGVGKATRQGCVYTLDQTNAIDRRVLGRVDKAVHAGSGSIQAPPGTIRCTITDRNTLNDTLLPACQ
jgi:hypothetical protein